MDELVLEQRVRSWRFIVGAATVLNMVSYIDRSCVSVAGPSIRRAFHLSPVQLGVFFSSFLFSYALFQLPWGIAADRFEPRRIITFAVLAWSAFTGLTGAAAGYLMLVLVRFAFGATEAALSPAISSMLARWVPEEWRATAFGTFLSGGRLGGAFAPIAATLLLLRFGWRSTFFVIAAIGLLAAGAWLRAVPPHLRRSLVFQQPAQHPASLRSFRLFSLLLVAFGYTFVWQFYATWFPTYLIERRGFTLGGAASYAALPFLVGIGSNWIGGFICDSISRKIGPTLSRGLVGCFSLLSATLFFYVGVIGPAKTVWLFPAAAGVGDLFLPLAWALVTELGGNSAGAFAGLMNTLSNLGGAASGVVLGIAIQHWKNWDSVLMIDVWVTLVSTLLWVGATWPRYSRPSSVLLNVR